MRAPGARPPYRFALVLPVLCRLQKLQKDIETAERAEGHRLQALRESEALLQAKRAELGELKSQVWQQRLERQLLGLGSRRSCCGYKHGMCLIVGKTGKCIVKRD